MRMIPVVQVLCHQVQEQVPAFRVRPGWQVRQEVKAEEAQVRQVLWHIFQFDLANNDEWSL